MCDYDEHPLISDVHAEAYTFPASKGYVALSARVSQQFSKPSISIEEPLRYEPLRLWEALLISVDCPEYHSVSTAQNVRYSELYQPLNTTIVPLGMKWPSYQSSCSTFN